MPWVPVAVLPNVNVKARVEGREACVVRYHHARLRRLRAEHPSFGLFLRRFKDAFGQPQRPSVLLLRRDRLETYRQSEAVAAFRDLLAICVVPYARAWVLINNMQTDEPRFANAFNFYPWMLDRDYDTLIANTPAVLATHDVDNFVGQLSPEISYYNVTRVDIPLLQLLIPLWERRFAAQNPEWQDLALFRSLNMAFHAAQTPFEVAGTRYDVGRLIGLWVSAFEILVHTGAGGRANPAMVKNKLSQSNPPNRQVRDTIYNALNMTRNHYFHGDPLRPNDDVYRLSMYGSVLYRYMLAECLGLRYRDRNVPAGPGRDDRIARAIVRRRDFMDHQKRYDDALDIYANPPQPDARRRR